MGDSTRTLPPGWVGNLFQHHLRAGVLTLQVQKGRNDRYRWEVLVGKVTLAQSDFLGLPTPGDARRAARARAKELVLEAGAALGLPVDGTLPLLIRVFTSYGGKGIVREPKDHGCPECWPGGEMTDPSFLCPYHEGLFVLGAGR